MRRVFKTAVATFATLAMVVGLCTGISVTSTEVKADATNVTLTKAWSFYQSGTAQRAYDEWAVSNFQTVTTTGGETKADWESTLTNAAWTPGPTTTWNTTTPSTGFTATIGNTGWDGEYAGTTLMGDNPYMLTADLVGIELTEGHMYTMSFDFKWTNSAKAPEKNILVVMNDSFTNAIVAETTKITTGTTSTYTVDFNLDAGSTVDLKIAMGAFLHSFKNGLTSEAEAAAGIFELSNFAIVDRGANPDWTPAEPGVGVEPATKPQATTKPQVTTKPQAKPQATTKPQVTTKAKKPAKVKGVKASNKKGKKIKISWKKASRAKKYQIKIGSKVVKTTKSLKYTAKVKKKKTYKVYVRAINSAGKGKWSKVVKVKVKK